MINLPKIKKAPTTREWVLCPNCKAKVCIFDDTAECQGVFLKCTRGCKIIFELVIEDGSQIIQSKQ